MFVLVRAVTYATLFIGLVLVYVPGRLLMGSGVVRPAFIGVRQIAGMIIGAGLALLGAALFYQSWPLLIYAAVFLLATHLFVLVYEEPTLRQTFDEEYEAYCRRVRRWWPKGKVKEEG